MRLESLSLAFALLSVVSAAAPDFLGKFPASADSCGPYSNTTASAMLWCKITASDDSSGCCIVDSANWTESKSQDKMQEWCDSIRANITVRSLDCSPDTEDTTPFSNIFGDDDDSSDTATSSLDSGSNSDQFYNKSDDDSNSDDNTGLSRSAIVGIVMGVIAGMFIFLIVGRWLAMSKPSKSPPMSTSTSWRIPDREQLQPQRYSSREPVLPVRVPTPPPVYSAPPPAYHA